MPSARCFETVVLPRALAARIAAQAQRAVPHECCGLLLGRADAIVDLAPAANIHSAPGSHYTIDPADHFAALREARERGLDVIGAFHSHPRSAPVPSPTDRALAFGDFLFVIVGPAATAPELRAWELVGGNFEEVALVLTS